MRAGDLGDPLRVAAGVGVARVDGARQARRGAEAGDAVAADREPLQVGQLDDVGAGNADAVLAVLLRPVERVVGEPDQLVALASMVGEGGDAGADRDRAHLVEVERRDPADDRVRGRERGGFVVLREQDRELVAAEPERLAALAEPSGDLRQHLVAGRVAEAVVDPLEVVDVDEAERQRQIVLLRRSELALQPLVEVAMVAEAGERVGEGEPHRRQGAVLRALVERDREQRAEERGREQRRPLPEDDEDQRRRAHQRERDRRPPDVRADQAEEAAAARPPGRLR